MEKEYICECGKIFTNSQSINGHKSHCKKYYLTKHGNLDNFNNKINKEIKKQKKLEQWESEKHFCEYCGKLMTEPYGSGRFCSRSCACSRTFSTETKEKISNSVKQNYMSEKRKSFLNKKNQDKLNKNIKIDNIELNITNRELNEFRKKITHCPICGISLKELQNHKVKKFVIDHDHETGLFRGLICSTCNRALGWYEKNTDNIMKYLNKSY